MDFRLTKPVWSARTFRFILCELTALLGARGGGVPGDGAPNRYSLDRFGSSDREGAPSPAVPYLLVRRPGRRLVVIVVNDLAAVPEE